MLKRRKFKSPKYPRSERGYWNWFHGTGYRCIIRRRSMHKKKTELLRAGYSIKDLFLPAVRYYLGHKRTFGLGLHHLADVHPKAWRYFEMYGLEYKSHTWRVPPAHEPQRHKCFRNARNLAYAHNKLQPEKGRKPRIKVGRGRGRHTLYNVQGIAYGPVVDPMLHGWNSWGGRLPAAIDWTFYAVNPWTLYIGIPFTHSEMLEISKTKGPKAELISVFDKSSFDLKVRVALTRVMHRRKRADKKVPIRTRIVKKAWPVKGRKVVKLKSPGVCRGSSFA